ncbi:MAG: GH92 family glycosyl hydrolase [Bacteroidales bacterium]|jgi:predicted alpha-1,2-mannosidase
MIRRVTYCVIIAILLFSCKNQNSNDLATLVDPIIGTDATGNTYPGATVPFGMVQLSPDTYNDGCCSGYHYRDTAILGFSHTHLSGTGVADFGDILVMAASGKRSAAGSGAGGSGPRFRGDDTAIDGGYTSAYKHSSERASPGYYSVFLEDSKIKAELTATKRVGFHRYTFPKSEESSILFDLQHGIMNGDKPLEDCFLRVVSPTEIEGLRHSQGWAPDQYVYFVARFSEPFYNPILLLDGQKGENAGEIKGKSVKGIFNFKTKEGDRILVKVALSATSTDGARRNLEAEVSGWDFEKIINRAEDAWNTGLGKIKVTGGSKDQQTIFYTALYHSMLTPNLYSDVDGQYRGMDHVVYAGEGFDYYTVFSLWDTYRAVHPLFNLIEPKRNQDFIKTMIKQYEQTGLLPVWELAGCENNCMIGYHAVPVIADAYLKGYRDFNADKAFEAMLASGAQNTEGIDSYRKFKFLPKESSTNSVSKVLEYAYDDWCIAQMAKSMGRMDKYREYIQRSQYYKNQYDAATGLMRPRHADGRWLTPFDPFKISLLDQGDYTEANAWHYSFYVPQNIPDLIRLSGGDQAFIQKLDTFFTTKTGNRNAVSDFEGIFGQYAHGNEPSHHMPYLYNYAGAPWKTQEIVKRAINEFYTIKPDGLCGNDDCGQLSAWYVFSALGFYPVCPGSDQYVIGSPVFDKAELTLPNGKKFTIKAQGAGLKTFYVQSATLNGKDYQNSFINFTDIMNGGDLSLKMGSSPEKEWGAAKENRPSALPVEPENQIKPLGTDKLFMPFIQASSPMFRGQTKIELGCISVGAEIHYTLNGTEPRITSEKYSQPFDIYRTSRIRAKAFKEGIMESETAAMDVYKSSLDPQSPRLKIEYLTPPFERDYLGRKVDGSYSPNYKAGGKMALVDGKKGSSDFTDGRWQGFEAKDMEVVIDIGRITPVWRITASFLQSLPVWIFHPIEISFSISSDGSDYEMMGVIDNYPDRATINDGIKYFEALVYGAQARYVKVRAKNIGLCPPWHHGAGGAAWLFADEVIVE